MAGNILIVDDSPVDRKIIRTVLEKRLSDVEIFEADNGEAARSVLSQYRISVCILDIVMSGMNGFQILEEMKNNNTLKDIPIIVCTALSDGEAIETALTLGAYDYFTKPLSEDAMKISLPLKVKNAIELKQRSDRIIYLSYHDKLTGLYNRRFYEEEILRLAAADYLPVSFIIGDVDGLKLTNDAYGHEAGDNLLIKITSFLTDAARENDIIIRTGGDEFLMLLPRTSNKEAEAVIAKIKSLCEEEMDSLIKPGISLGMATRELPEQNINSIYKLAEDNMYSNKLMRSKNVKDSIILSLRNALKEK